MGADSTNTRNKRRRSQLQTTGTEQTKSKLTPPRYHCDNCRGDISNFLRIRCAECSDFDLCIECFLNGAEVHPHKNSHPYHIIDNLSFPLLDDNWDASEELLLLEGLQSYGMGNWEDIADHIGTKDKEQCEQHYRNYYINSATAPLPDMSKCLAITNESLVVRNRFGEDKANRITPLFTAPEQEVSTPAAPKAKKGKEKDQKPILKSEPLRKFEDGSKPSPGEAAGFMPIRKDFETEYDNDAELVIADMTWDHNDTPEMKKIKLSVLEFYNKKLEKRADMKKFVLERDLVMNKNPFAQFAAKLSKEEKDLIAKFQTTEEHIAFLDGIIKEHRLRADIQKLQQWRQMGFRSISKAEFFENHVKRKEDDIRRVKETSTYTYERLAHKHYKLPNRDLLDPNDTKASKKSKPVFDISDLDGYDLLSAGEREVCVSLKLRPHQYMVIKETLLKESLKTGQLKRSDARNLTTIDPSKTTRLYDFFCKAGWLGSSDKGDSGAQGTDAGSTAQSQLGTAQEASN